MCASMKLAVFMDIEVRSGCVSIESGYFMDIEVRIGCSAYPSARRVGLQVLQRHPGVANRASDRSSARIPCPQVLQGHLRVSKCLVSDLRHSDPAHRCLSGILAEPL